MKVSLKYVDVLYITPNDFTQKGGAYTFKTGVEASYFNTVVQAVTNIAASQNFAQFGLRVFSAKGFETFTKQLLNAQELPAICFIDFDNPNDAAFTVLTTINKSELTENRLYDLADYFAALKKENGVYYKKDGSVWADLRKGKIEIGKNKPNSTQTEGTQSDRDANDNATGFLPIYIPVLSEFSEVLDGVLESIAPNFKSYIYLGIAALSATGAVTTDNTPKKITMGSVSAYSFYRFYQLKNGKK